MPASAISRPAAVDKRGRLAMRLAWWAIFAWLLGWSLPFLSSYFRLAVRGSGGGDVGAGLGMAAFVLVATASGVVGTFISSALVVWAFCLKHRSIPLWIAATFDVVSWITAAWLFWGLRWMLR